MQSSIGFWFVLSISNHFFFLFFFFKWNSRVSHSNEKRKIYFSNVNIESWHVPIEITSEQVAP